MVGEKKGVNKNKQSTMSMGNASVFRKKMSG